MNARLLASHSAILRHQSQSIITCVRWCAGNSTSAILAGTATLTLLPRGEQYRVTMPYAHCKGILIGTLSMELGGKVTIECEKTGYTTDLEFKLKVRAGPRRGGLGTGGDGWRGGRSLRFGGMGAKAWLRWD